MIYRTGFSKRSCPIGYSEHNVFVEKMKRAHMNIGVNNKSKLLLLRHFLRI